MRTLTRRSFLKLGGAAALGFAFRLPPAEDNLPSQTPKGLGRVTRALQAYEQPSFSAKKVRVFGADTVLNIYEEKAGDAEMSHNVVWFGVDDGWVHSSFVQPVRNDLNEPILDMPDGGFLAEVTVPFTQAWHNDDGEPQASYRFYYSTAHWVDRAVTDKKGNLWYRVFDDRHQVYHFVVAKHLRRVPEEELTPLGPGILDKRIEVDLTQQKLSAYENGSPVLTARLSSGRPGAETPTGAFRVERKRPSRHTLAPRLRAAQVQVWPRATVGATASTSPACRGFPISTGRVSPFTARTGTTTSVAHAAGDASTLPPPTQNGFIAGRSRSCRRVRFTCATRTEPKWWCSEARDHARPTTG